VPYFRSVMCLTVPAEPPEGGGGDLRQNSFDVVCGLKRGNLGYPIGGGGEREVFV
jgi:hypothetical protein